MQLTPTPSTSQAVLELTSDAELVRQSVNGAKDAFNQLIIRYQDRLFRFLSRSATSPHDAEDAMQQALVKAYLNLARYNPKWQFTTWLYTIALRELRSLSRRASLKTTTLENAGDPAAHFEESQQEEGALLWNTARKILSTQQYTALWLRYGEDLQPREIASIMRRPRVWVSVTLNRACATLRTATQTSNTFTNQSL